nr:MULTISPECIES: hypothetical protein [Nocardia]
MAFRDYCIHPVGVERAQYRGEMTGSVAGQQLVEETVLNVRDKLRVAVDRVREHETWSEGIGLALPCRGDHRGERILGGVQSRLGCLTGDIGERFYERVLEQVVALLAVGKSITEDLVRSEQSHGDIDIGSGRSAVVLVAMCVPEFEVSSAQQLVQLRISGLGADRVEEGGDHDIVLGVESDVAMGVHSVLQVLGATSTQQRICCLVDASSTTCGAE